MNPRLIRGVDGLVDYLNKQDIKISRSTIYTLKNHGEIPYQQITPRIAVFDLNQIDAWLIGADND